MANAIIYCRVSTKEQVEDGNSLKTQEHICRDFAIRNGYELVAEPFIEEGESAKTANRPKLIQMMEWCRKNKGKVDTLIIYKVNRFSRNTNDYLALKINFNHLGVKIVSCTEHLEESPAGRFSETVLAAQAQFDNEVRAEICTNGSIELVRKGMRNGRFPLGYQKYWIEGKTRQVRHVEPYKSHILRAFELLATGAYNQEQVRKQLHGEGFRMSNGKAVSSQTFDKIIHNPVYKGLLIDYGQNATGDFEPIVPPALFDQVQDFLNGRKKKMPKYKKANPDFPIRGSMRCEHGEKFTASTVRGHGGKYKKYRVNCEECRKRNFDASEIHSDFADYLADHEYDNSYIEGLKIAIKINWNQRNEHVNERARSLEKFIFEQEERKQQISDKILDRPEQEDIWSEKLDITVKKQREAKAELEKIVKPEQVADEVVEFGTHFLSHLSEFWQNAPDLETKQRFQNFFFPEGLTYHQERKFGTSVLPLCMKIKATSYEPNYRLVASMNFVSNTFWLGWIN